MYNGGMKIFDGLTHAKKLETQIKKAKKPKDKTLLIAQIGDNASARKYITLKMKLCEKHKIPCEHLRISSDKEDSEIMETLGNKFKMEKYSGVIVQLPLPRQSLQTVLNKIPIEKDLDMLSNTKKNQFYTESVSFEPPILRAFKLFSVDTKIKTKGLRVVILGAGELVSKPISHYLAQQGAKVKVMDTPEKLSTNFSNVAVEKIGRLYEPGHMIDCDLLVSTAGVPKLVVPSALMPGTHVVDFGSSVVASKTVGDLDLSLRHDHLGWVSPSPGGMGPLVVRYLVMNFLGI